MNSGIRHSKSRSKQGYAAGGYPLDNGPNAYTM